VRRVLALLLGLVPATERLAFPQDVSVKLGVARTIRSTILNEDRKVVVHLPESYGTSAKSYPVLYLLDGNTAFLLELIAITSRLRTSDGPEMIIVAIENTDRDRDMMPMAAQGFPGSPRGEAFLGFIEKELIPEIEHAYRTVKPRFLLGKSLSGLFTIYAMLARPTIFDGYVGCSAGWFTENHEYFQALAARSFQHPESYANRRIFMGNSLQDRNDPDQAIHRRMVEFSKLVKARLGTSFPYKYVTYADYPHVPFPCLYDGVRFVAGGHP